MTFPEPGLLHPSNPLFLNDKPCLAEVRTLLLELVQLRIQQCLAGRSAEKMKSRCKFGTKTGTQFWGHKSRPSYGNKEVAATVRGLFCCESSIQRLDGFKGRHFLPLHPFCHIAL